MPHWLKTALTIVAAVVVGFLFGYYALGPIIFG